MVKKCWANDRLSGGNGTLDLGANLCSTQLYINQSIVMAARNAVMMRTLGGPRGVGKWR